LNRDYEELFKELNAHGVKYLVVGAHAVIYYTRPRATKDIDLWIPPELNNPKKVYQALRRFGAPLRGVSPADFTDKEMIYQIGVAPVRIDILMSVKGLSAKEAWNRGTKSRYGKVPISLLAKEDLIQAKEAVGRPADLNDIKQLKRRSGK